MKISALSSFNEKYMFSDRCRVFRPVVNDGTMTFRLVEELQDIPCYLSTRGKAAFSSGNKLDNASDRRYDYNPVVFSHLLFLRPEDEVLAGDICEVEHCGEITRYEVGKVHSFGFFKECNIYCKGEA